MTTKQMLSALYGPDSVFTPEEQAAMKRGYTMAQRRAESGRMFGIYPQAISEEHARKLDDLNGFIRIRRLEHWPNHLGFVFSAGNTQFEVWNDGRFVRIASDESLCGCYGIEYLDYRGEPLPEDKTAIAKLCYSLWQTQRHRWQPCAA